MSAINHEQAVAPLAERAAPGVTERHLRLPLVRVVELGLLGLGSALLVASIFFPYWEMTLHAPQYPMGLDLDVYVNKMEPARNVFEVNGLNHYIGMMKLDDAARIERQISIAAIAVVALLTIGSFFLRGKWRWIVRLPIIAYPAIFVADLFGWLYYAGHSLDPHRPLTTITEFTPRILGEGVIGQFSTQAFFSTGFWLAVAAALLVLAGTILAARHGGERA